MGSGRSEPVAAVGAEEPLLNWSVVEGPLLRRSGGRFWSKAPVHLSRQRPLANVESCRSMRQESWVSTPAVYVSRKQPFTEANQGGCADFDHLILRAIESPVLNRFRYMDIRDVFHAREIRNRARDLENAMIPAR